MKARYHRLIHLSSSCQKVTNHTSRHSWYLFCVPIVALITCNDGVLSLFQEIFLGQQQSYLQQSLSPAFSSPTVVSKLPDGVKARAKCPDGSTVTGIPTPATSYCSKCAESASITSPNSRSISRPSKMGVTILGTMCTAKRSCLVPGSGNQIRVSEWAFSPPRIR